VSFDEPVDPGKRQCGIDDINGGAADESRAGTWAVRTDIHHKGGGVNYTQLIPLPPRLDVKRDAPRIQKIIDMNILDTPHQVATKS